MNLINLLNNLHADEIELKINNGNINLIYVLYKFNIFDYQKANELMEAWDYVEAKIAENTINLKFSIKYDALERFKGIISHIEWLGGKKKLIESITLDIPPTKENFNIIKKNIKVSDAVKIIDSKIVVFLRCCKNTNAVKNRLTKLCKSAEDFLPH